ncbi:unnamed protein product [Owenia fusiformis]|uniref:Uncharacterized protein n=1 Tax=Owenia fusiformis TaxID=6347 RepID=A0A8S4PXV1_OWEFU|nr:unnamed protein product [Owenia fusiformis]
MKNLLQVIVLLVIITLGATLKLIPETRQKRSASWLENPVKDTDVQDNTYIKRSYLDSRFMGSMLRKRDMNCCFTGGCTPMEQKMCTVLQIIQDCGYLSQRGPC